MRRLFGTDEAYYAVIFILLLIVNGGFALFGFEKLAGHTLQITLIAAESPTTKNKAPSTSLGAF